MTSTHASPSQVEEATLHRIVADIEQGFNDNDPEALVRHIAADAVIVNPLGTVMRGAEEVEASVRPLLTAGALHRATAHYRLSDISMLAPDVAVAHKSAWATQAEADGGEPPQMNALYVFVRRKGTWWIVRRQNTAVGS